MQVIGRRINLDLVTNLYIYFQLNFMITYFITQMLSTFLNIIFFINFSYYFLNSIHVLYNKTTSRVME